MVRLSRHAVRKRLDVVMLEDRVVPAGWTAWTTADPAAPAWVATATVWEPQTEVILAGTSDDTQRAYLPLRLKETTARAMWNMAPSWETGGLGTVIALPDPYGNLQRFEVWSIPTMAAELAADHPEIATYRGRGIDDPSAILAADFTHAGFHAQVIAPTAYTIFPAQTVSDGNYKSFFTADDLHHGAGCNCALCTGAVSDVSPPAATGGFAPQFTFGTDVRNFRLAVATTGEYTAAAGGTPALALSAITTTMNSVNAIFERDFGVHMNLIANNADVIFTDAATDPFDTTNLGSMITANQIMMENVIGSANFDIGHVFDSSNLGGGASVGVVGGVKKARGGSTSGGNDVVNTFMTFLVAHEMGHQFGAGHAFNGVSTSLTANRMETSAWEPGSGDSLMGYPNDTTGGQAYSTLWQYYFHSGSINQVRTYLDTIPSVGTTVAISNAAPVVNAGIDRSIPANTPFTLTMSATDADGDALLVNWDQIDLGIAQALGSPDNGTSPLFRSYFPTTTSLTRTLPNLTSLLANTPYAPEVLPSTNRVLNFRATARDNRVGGAAATSDDVRYTVVNTGSAFAVTYPSLPAVLVGGAADTITWNVAGTTGSGINTATVNILLSTDGGLTFPTTLATATANDGSETVTLPVLNITTARIKIEAVGNVFFDVSNTNFTIAPTPQALVVTTTADSGPGSLRAAIATANANPNPDLITFDPTLFSTPQTITLTTGELLITNPVTITGRGANLTTISGNNASRVFNTNNTTSNISVTLTDLKITGGLAVRGAGVDFSNETVTLNRVWVTANTATVSGGGIAHSVAGGNLTLLNSTVDANVAQLGSSTSGGGGIQFGSAGVVVIRNSTIANNTASATSSAGGGINVATGVTSLTIEHTTIVGNKASTTGGGLRLASGSYPVTITNSIVAKNTSTAGIADLVVAGTMAITVTNSALGSTSFTAAAGTANNIGAAGLLLSPLQNNGGPIPTITLASSGTPTDGINDGAPTTLATDQRGFPRSVAAPDMGDETELNPVLGLSINGGDSQRSRVTSIAVNLSAAPMDAMLLTNPGGITLTRTSGGPPVTLTVGSGLSIAPLTGTVTSITLTFTGMSAVEFGSLADGRWQLSIPFLQFISPLNGPDLRRLFGDANNDLTVNIADLTAFGNAFNTSNPVFDFDADGVVSIADLTAFGNRFGLVI